MLKHTAIGLVLVLSLAACDEGGGGAAATSAPASAKPAATTAPKAPKTAAATATATATAAPAEGKLTEYDLSSAGDKWKGYTAKLPVEGAKVMADGVDGARLATNARDANPFDLAWAPGKGKLADLKKGLEAAAKTSKVKTTFQVDSPEGLEYTNEGEGGTKSYHFDIVVKVGTADFHCYSLPMGLSNEAQLKAHKEACKTLAKK